MPDIDAYREYERYMKYQRIRPDYTQAIASSLQLARSFVPHGKVINVADFCCGTGSNTKALAEQFGGINKAVLIDINKGFLDIAKNSGINAKTVEILNEDILNVNLDNDCDLVLSIFAYHHVADNQKEKYLEQVKSALKKKGILILTEIYLGNNEICLRYYKELFNSIDKKKIIPGLKDFLMQTAQSNDFEFKVSKKFADDQLKKAGFSLLTEKKIYPQDKSFKEDQGTWVQVYQLL